MPQSQVRYIQDCGGYSLHHVNNTLSQLNTNRGVAVDLVEELVCPWNRNAHSTNEPIPALASRAFFPYRETSTPPLHRGGAIVAALSLLQPRPTHRQKFNQLGEGESWSKQFGRSTRIWEEVRRLRELYPVSINNLVLFLGLLRGLEDVFQVLRVSCQPGKHNERRRSAGGHAVSCLRGHQCTCHRPVPLYIFPCAPARIRFVVQATRGPGMVPPLPD